MRVSRTIVPIALSRYYINELANRAKSYTRARAGSEKRAAEEIKVGSNETFDDGRRK